MTAPTGQQQAAHVEGPNALSHAIGLLGDEWTLLLLRGSLSGATRYSQFSAKLPISYAVLTNRLELLVREELLERRVYQENPVRAEYVLTQKGRSVWPLLAAIWAWERQWVPEHSYSTPPMRHTTCGADMAPAYCCAACHAPVEANALHTEWGPAGDWQSSVPEARTRRRSTSRSKTRGGSFYPDTMAVFGNRWSAAVVGAAFRGVTRFKDFQDLLEVPPSLLAERLSSLCERKILEQVSLPDRPDWAEYRLTAKGRGLFPAIAIVNDWAEHWYGSPRGPVLKWTHVTCGAAFKGVLTCDKCTQPLTGSDIQLDEAV